MAHSARENPAAAPPVALLRRTPALASCPAAPHSRELAGGTRASSCRLCGWPAGGAGAAPLPAVVVVVTPPFAPAFVFPGHSPDPRLPPSEICAFSLPPPIVLLPLPFLVVLLSVAPPFPHLSSGSL